MGTRQSEEQKQAVIERENAPKFRYRLRLGKTWGKTKQWGHGSISKYPNGSIVELRKREAEAVPHLFHLDSQQAAAYDVKSAEAAVKVAADGLKKANEVATKEEKEAEAETKKTEGKKSGSKG